MAAEANAWALAAVSQTPEPFRAMLLDMFGRRPGIMTPTSWATTQTGTPSMGVVVALGSGLVLGSETTTQGGYFCRSTSNTTLTITAANATNPRWDIIVARVRDNEYSTGPTSAFSLEVVTGTPAASPAEPAKPANSLVIARVTVAANATSITNANIIDWRTAYTGQTKAAALGGILPCLAAGRPTLGLYDGQVAYETDTDRVIVYNGTAWVGLGASTTPPPQFFAGSVAGGTQTTTFAAIITQNSVLVAPYPLTMVVEVVGDVGANTTANVVHLEISDEAGTSIVTGPINPAGVFALTNKNAAEGKAFSVMAKKDYTAGQTCGFRFRYRVDTSNIFIGAYAKVTFWPKVS